MGPEGYNPAWETQPDHCPLTCGQATSHRGGAAPRVEAGDTDSVRGGGGEGAQRGRGGVPRGLRLQGGWGQRQGLELTPKLERGQPLPR